MLHGRAAQRELETASARRAAVQVEENEARRVAAADVVDDLVFRLLLEPGRVDADAIVEEAQLGAELVRLREFGLEVRIRAPEIVAVAAADRRLGDERRAIRIRARVLTNFGVGRANLRVHETLIDGNASDTMKLPDTDG